LPHMCKKAKAALRHESTQVTFDDALLNEYPIIKLKGVSNAKNFSILPYRTCNPFGSVQLAIFYL
jgi:hypothetical protein